ncbi:MAG TPA: CvpA family protein [Candidatus Koribacter sp.]|jgi:membrane protein required for colicin V production
MTLLDWTILLVIVFSTAIAAAQGFVKEIFSLAGALVGYLLAAWEYPKVAVWYANYVSSTWVADIAAFLTIFLLVVVLAGALARIVNWAVSGVGLGWFDRTLGAIFGAVRGIAVSAVIVMAMAAFVPNSPVLRHSSLAPYFLVLSRTASWIAPADLRNRFRQGVVLIRSAEDKAPSVLPPPKKSK